MKKELSLKQALGENIIVKVPGKCNIEEIHTMREFPIALDNVLILNRAMLLEFTQMRMLYFMFSLVHSDVDVQSKYEINIKTYHEIFGMKYHGGQQFKDARDDALRLGLPVTFMRKKENGKTETIQVAFIRDVKVDEDRSIISYRLSTDGYNFLCEMKHFTKFSLINLINVKSKYTYLFYTAFISILGLKKRNEIELRLNHDELRGMAGVGDDEYCRKGVPCLARLKEKVLRGVFKEITETTNLNVEMIEKDEKGKRIKGAILKISKKSDEETKKIIDKKNKLLDKNIGKETKDEDKGKK